MKRIVPSLPLASFLLVAPSAAGATVILNASGTDPDVSVQAELSISGDVLTVVLTNDSANASAGPSELLTSFYFDIANGSGDRPTLTYVSATGDVYTSDDENPDPLAQAGADLVADDLGDDTWQFKQGLSLPAGSAALTFGIGTVGNKQPGPDDFDVNIVHREEYGISAGDTSGHKLDGAPLVNAVATFTFSGVDGWTEDDIGAAGLFGFGKKPDSTLVAGDSQRVPEPAAALPLAMGLLGLGWAGRRRS